MGFLDELKKLTHPYDEDEEEYMDDAELVDEPQPDKPRPNPFSGFGSESASSSSFGTILLNLKILLSESYVLSLS